MESEHFDWRVFSNRAGERAPLPKRRAAPAPGDLEAHGDVDTPGPAAPFGDDGKGPGAPPPEPTPGQPARVLLVGDAAFTRSELQDAWHGGRPKLFLVPSADRAQAWLRAQRADCVLWQAGDEWRSVGRFLREMRRTAPPFVLPLVVWQSTHRPATAMAAYRAGASEVVGPPCNAGLLGARLSAHCRLGHFFQSRERTLGRLRREADTDPLTRIANRRAFFRRLEAELVRAQRHGQLVSLVVGDIDHFKGINDRHGHPMGDRVLVEVARQLRVHARAYDWVGRLGGEEFALLLPHAEETGAWRAAERMRQTIARTFAAHEGLPPITLSLGVAMGPVGPRDDVHSLWGRADRALYAAKMRGRNQVVVHDPDTGVPSPAGQPPGPAARALMQECVG